MDLILMSSENSEKSVPHRILLNLLDKKNWKRSGKCVSISNLRIYNTLKNIKKTYEKKIIKISAPTWNEEFELPDGSYSVSGIQDYFQYIFKNLEKRQLLISLQ